MRLRESLGEIMRQHIPRGELPPAARSVSERLISGQSALLVAPDAAERELAWKLAAAAGRLPVLIVAPSDRGLARRAEEFASDLDLIACHLHAELTDHALDVLAQQFAAGKWDAAFVSGRSLGDPRLRRAAEAMAPGLLVIEDAHKLSVHGLKFDLAWLHAAQLARNADGVLAVTDVASAQARDDIVASLAGHTPRTVLSGLDRPDVRIEVRRVPNQPQKDSHLLGLFRDAPHRAVVHVDHRVEAERIEALIRDERGFDAVDLTQLGSEEFSRAIRSFCEGGVRVLVTTGALEPARDWPEIPVVATVGLPESVELLHRQMQTASGEGACFTLIHQQEKDAEDEEDGKNEEEKPRPERLVLGAAPDTGQLLTLHAAAISGERLPWTEISRRSGLHPDDIALGIDALIHAGAVRAIGRGDDWIKGEPGAPLTAQMLRAWGSQLAEIREARLERMLEVPGFVESRGCHRRWLADALDYPLEDGDCRCNRCRPRAPVRISARIPGGYPLKTGGFRGWALALYRRPGEDTPTEGPGMLVERLKCEGEEGCGRRLAWLMHRRVRESRTYRDCDVIVAVPSSDPAAADSPAEMLAREIARLSQMPVTAALLSARDRDPQKELASDSAKRRNVRGAFEVPSAAHVEGRTVLLVDDIYDSGATMEEAARTLVRAGARDVRMLAAVRTAFGWRRNT